MEVRLKKLYSSDFFLIEFASWGAFKFENRLFTYCSQNINELKKINKMEGL